MHHDQLEDGPRRLDHRLHDRDGPDERQPVKMLAVDRDDQFARYEMSSARPVIPDGANQNPVASVLVLFKFDSTRADLPPRWSMTARCLRGSSGSLDVGRLTCPTMALRFFTVISKPSTVSFGMSFLVLLTQSLSVSPFWTLSC